MTQDQKLACEDAGVEYMGLNHHGEPMYGVDEKDPNGFRKLEKCRPLMAAFIRGRESLREEMKLTRWETEVLKVVKDSRHWSSAEELLGYVKVLTAAIERLTGAEGGR